MIVYLPPIILFAALIALVVILGKKIVFLRKKNISSVRTDEFRKIEQDSSRIQNISKRFAILSASVVFFLKIILNKAETFFAETYRKIQEKRRTKSTERKPNENIESNQKYYQKNDFLTKVENAGGEIEKKQTFNAPVSIQDISGETDRLFEGVIMKRKKEVIPQRIVPELAKEDKVREDALIHRIAENPKDMEAYREIGDYYMSIGNIKDAKDSFKMVLKLRPRDLKAKSSLREIEMKMRLGS